MFWSFEFEENQFSVRSITLKCCILKYYAWSVWWCPTTQREKQLWAQSTSCMAVQNSWVFKATVCSCAAWKHRTVEEENSFPLCVAALFKKDGGCKEAHLTLELCFGSLVSVMAHHLVLVAFLSAAPLQPHFTDTKLNKFPRLLLICSLLYTEIANFTNRCTTY